jgi:mono/diheme cytochrome c family protein
MLRSLWLVPLVALTYGGWAAITVRDLPDYVVAGQPVTLTFTVRQHGVRLLSGLSASVDARSGDDRVTTAAAPGRGEGQYVATLTLPRPGEWSITIHSGFGNSRVTLLPVRALAAGMPAPAALAERERGRRLFVAKGCVTCHVHGDVAGSGVVPVGPELTAIRLPADFLAQFLANPAIAAKNGTFQMPNLDLTAQEIAALVAFLGGERRGASAPSSSHFPRIASTLHGPGPAAER